MTATTAPDPALDAAPGHPAEEFSEQVFGWYTGAFVTFMIDLGHRCGLFEAATHGPATAAELAGRAGLDDRYVREWLGAMATAGVVTFDPTSASYTLPEHHAVCLTGDHELNLAPISQVGGHLAGFIGPVAECFRHGGGVPYSEYRPEFTDVMDGLSRPLFDGVLVEGIVGAVDGLTDLLTAGTRVIDVGCGTGHSTNVLARAFPHSEITGLDLATDAIAAARAEAAEWGLPNVDFEVCDVADLAVDAPVGAAFAFDAIHDQADPATVLRRIYETMEPGGVFVMVDIRASSRLETNLENPFAPMLYAVSTLHCMTVSLAAGGAGLGTVWGEELAVEMLADAGFVDIEVHEIPGDPMDSTYVARRPGES